MLWVRDPSGTLGSLPLAGSIFVRSKIRYLFPLPVSPTWKGNYGSKSGERASPLEGNYGLPENRVAATGTPLFTVPHRFTPCPETGEQILLPSQDKKGGRQRNLLDYKTVKLT